MRATVGPGARRGRSAPLAAAAFAGVALLADIALDPAHRHVPLCPFHAATGWWCPLCGSLRAVDALAHLQLRSAVQDNVLLVAALPLLAWWWIDWVRRAGAGQPPWRLGPRAIAGLVIVAVGFTVLRNLPAAGALRPG